MTNAEHPKYGNIPIYGGSGSAVKTVNVTPEPRSAEHKATGKFLEAINTLTFNPRVVAVAFSLAPTLIQQRLMEVFRFWCDILEAEFDRGAHRDDIHLETQVMAKRLNEGMLPYEE